VLRSKRVKHHEKCLANDSCIGEDIFNGRVLGIHNTYGSVLPRLHRIWTKIVNRSEN